MGGLRTRTHETRIDFTAFFGIGFLGDARDASASRRIVAELLHRREPPGSANSGLMHRSKTAQSFDHLVGSYLQSQRNCKPKCFGSFEVYKKFKLARLQDR
jgi:hypothetical protein